MTASADHEREPLPLGAVGWGVTLTMFGFGFWGYLMRSGAISSGFDEKSAGWLVLGVLSGVMQFGAALGAKALRRSKNFELNASSILSGVLVAGGALVTGCAVHNALQVTGMDPISSVLIAIGVPVCEFAVWWVDESLRSEAQTRKNAADVLEAQERSAQDRGVHRLPDFRMMTDAALDIAIGEATGMKRKLEIERGRRRKQKIRTNEG